MSDLVPYQGQPTDSWVPVLGAVGDLAGKLAGTAFVPRAMQRQPASVAAAILTGREMGLGPMASLRGIDVIEGRPSLTAQMLAARIYAAGHRIEWVASDDKRCTVRIERGDGLSSAEATWTLGDAQRAGLAGKKVWQQYPRHMLRARALTECASMACPDVALGLDVAGDPDQPPVARPAGDAAVQTVQLAPVEAPPVALRVTESDEPEPEVQPPTPEPQPEAEAEAGPMVTPAQLRKINAQLGELERARGEPYGRDGRRDLIRHVIGLDALASAKDLTREQASTAVERLDVLIDEAAEATSDVVDAEVVDVTTGEVVADPLPTDG